jgi:hypothetical protein
MVTFRSANVNPATDPIKMMFEYQKRLEKKYFEKKQLNQNLIVNNFDFEVMRGQYVYDKINEQHKETKVIFYFNG